MDNLGVAVVVECPPVWGAPMADECAVDGCLRPASKYSKDNYCEAHRKRLQRGSPVTTTALRELPGTPWRRLLEAAKAVWDADTDEGGDEEFDRACARLRMAARAYRDK